MNRILLYSLFISVVALTSGAQSMYPEQPAPYVPYPSESMFARLNTNVEMLNWDEVDAVIPAQFKYKRLAPVYQPKSVDGVYYKVDTITPSCIILNVSPSQEALSRNIDENVLQIQLGALPGNEKKPKGVVISTLYPGGVGNSFVNFYEFPSYQQMQETDMKADKDIDSFYNFYLSVQQVTDSLPTSITKYAESINAIEPLPFDEDYLPQRTHREGAKLLKASSYLKEPTLTDFFKLPSGAKGKEVRELIAAIPFPMVTYTLNPSDLSIKATLNYTPLVSLETSNQLKAYAKPYLRYVWDGKRYKLVE